MNDRSRDEHPNRYESPACFMHEADPAYTGLSAPDPGETVIGWRNAERERLIQQRLTITSEQRRDHSECIASRLDELVGDPSGLVISAYWPFRGEPDLRAWLDGVAERGARTALPVVIGRGQPLQFRLWRRGDPLERGVWNIPVPPSNAERVSPDVVIAPVVGFDNDGFRLGYGGGYFDRTLAAMPAKPRAIGVGYSQALLRTIYPQPHDIPMDFIVTEISVVTNPAIHRRATSPNL